MKKQTSTQAIWLRSLLLVPLLAILLYGFSTKKYLFLPHNNPVMDVVEHIQIHVNSNEEFTLNGYNTTINNIDKQLKIINPSLSKEDRKKRITAHIYSDGNAKMGLITDIKNKLLDYGIHQFVSHPLEKKIKPENNTTQDRATQTEINLYNTLAKKYNAMPKENMRIVSDEVGNMTAIYNKMTPKQKENGEPFPNFPPPPPAPPVPDAPKVAKNPPLPLLPAPPPPAPLSDPMEYIKALHKSGAVFFIGPHQYNYERVLEMAKKTTDLNIDISQYPKVNLLGC